MERILNICEKEFYISEKNKNICIGKFCYDTFNKQFFILNKVNTNLLIFDDLAELIHLFNEKSIIKNLINSIVALIKADKKETVIIIPDKMQEWAVSYLFMQLNAIDINNSFVIIRKAFFDKEYDNYFNEGLSYNAILTKKNKSSYKDYKYKFNGSIGFFLGKKWIEILSNNFYAPISQYLTLKIPRPIEIGKINTLIFKFYFKTDIIDFIELDSFFYDLTDIKEDIYLNIEITIKKSYKGLIKVFLKNMYDEPVFFENFNIPNLIYKV